MNCMKTIIAAAILSTSVAIPAFAQDVGNVDNVGAAGSYAGPARYSHGREGRMQRFYQSYNQVGPDVVAPPPAGQAYRNLENFGLSGRDPSRVGGYSPNLNPPGS